MNLKNRNKSVVLVKINQSFDFSKNLILTPQKKKYSLFKKDDQNSSSNCIQKLTEDIFEKRLKYIK